MAVSSGVKWSHYPPALLMLSFAPLQVETGFDLLLLLVYTGNQHQNLPVAADEI